MHMPNYFIYNGRLPSLNEYIAANRKHLQAGAQFKRKWQSAVGFVIKRYKNKGLLQPVESPCIIKFTYHEKTARRDLDNITGFAHKVILDSLVELGILPNDTQKWVQGFTDTFLKSDNDFIKIEIEQTSQS